jgi:uncharacterized damage-inducible protein DinB
MLRDAHPLPGFPAPYDLLGAVLQDGTKEWRDEIESDLDEEFMVWQPYPRMHSIGAVMLHIMSVEVSWFERFVLGLPRDPEERKLLMTDEIDVDDWRWPTPPRKPLSWYFELHDGIRARTLEGLKNWPEADLAIDRGDGQARTPRWVLGHVIQHEAYHGGQAVLLSRLKALSESGSL